MSTIGLKMPFAAGRFNQQTQTRMLMENRAALDDLMRQVSSGKRTNTHAGLGEAGASVLAMRNSVAQSKTYSDVIALGTSRIASLSQSVQSAKGIAEQARTLLVRTSGIGSYSDTDAAAKQTRAQMDTLINTLNTQQEGQYLFSGRARDTKPVLDSATLLNGDGTKAGLLQIIDERRQADSGAGTGRLATNVAGGTFSLSEEATPFGIKLLAGTIPSTLSNMTSVSPSGSPQSLSITFTAPPLTGETLLLTVVMPDGTQETATFEANTQSTGNTVFDPGLTANDAATNLQAAVSGWITGLTASKMRQCSAHVAATDFFASTAAAPPQRIAGPPFASATAFAAAGTRPSVEWYAGDDAATLTARDTQTIRLDSGVVVGFGVRANEPAFRDTLAAMAIVLSEDYSAHNTVSQDRFAAASSKALGLLNSSGGPEAILGIETELGAASTLLTNAKTRHTAQASMLDGLVNDMENVDMTEISAQLTALQNQLQASYTITARLSQLSLVSYL